MLKIWNTATRKLEDFIPINQGRVGMYTCGPTVYWNAHIGNLRTYVLEDILERVLEYNGLKVTRVLNITDVGHLTSDEDQGEDKVEKAAAKSGKTAQEIANEYATRFISDALKLNIKLPAPPYLCRATEHIPVQIELIKILEKKGYTYKTSDGIYFDTSKFTTYGSFSGQRLEEKEEGARIETNPEKKHKTDFALWKFSYPGGVSRQEYLDSRFHGNDDQKNTSADAGRGTRDIAQRQMEWESPWGLGFPGWHVECSAMSRKYLGQPFDIHCGGIDHIPVHHENEIAQSEAAYGTRLANCWLHMAFLLVEDQKMSKSLGNVFTLSDVIKRGFDPLALRLFFLGAHYRQIQNFTWEALQAAQNALQKIRNEIRCWDEPSGGCPEEEADFIGAFNDDLNAPKALAVLWKLISSDKPSSAKAASLLKMDRILGLSLADYIAKPIEIPEEIKSLSEKREIARSNKNWKESDELRKEIDSRGWLVEDTSEGQKITPK
ncbi:MAG: cysteine--tRNA ligase [Patescibacteria group bacterium]